MEAPEQQSQLELSQQPQHLSVATSKPMSKKPILGQVFISPKLDTIKTKKYTHWKKRDIGTQTECLHRLDPDCKEPECIWCGKALSGGWDETPSDKKSFMDPNSPGNKYDVPKEKPPIDLDF
jgi:hypothetical protein